MMTAFGFLSFFFFQAEDGIRDKLVTGVQTCALPICTRPVDFQQSLYNKSHPDLPRFIERIRKVADEYGGRFTVAEVGGEGSEAEMQRLTSGNARFHTAYGFNFLYANRLTPELIRTALGAWPE